jgi:hypothetical protein
MVETLWRRTIMEILPTYKNSFFTNPERKDGLGLNMFYEKGTVYTDMFVDNRFEGYEDVCMAV